MSSGRGDVACVYSIMLRNLHTVCQRVCVRVSLLVCPFCKAFHTLQLKFRFFYMRLFFFQTLFLMFFFHAVGETSFLFCERGPQSLSPLPPSLHKVLSAITSVYPENCACESSKFRYKTYFIMLISSKCPMFIT